MEDLPIEKNGSVNVVDSRLLHKRLEVASYHADWIRRRIDNYGFQEGKDFYSIMSGSTGGRRAKAHLLTLDMAKELAMLENNEVGKEIRRYFIRRDNELRKIETSRLAGIEVRKTLTEAIMESGENDRMHGHGYSTFTRLACKLTGIEVGTRDELGADDLDRLEAVETIIKGLIKAGKQYSEIKSSLLPLFQAA